MAFKNRLELNIRVYYPQEGGFYESFSYTYVCVIWAPTENIFYNVSSTKYRNISWALWLGWSPNLNPYLAIFFQSNFGQLVSFLQAFSSAKTEEHLSYVFRIDCEQRRKQCTGNVWNMLSSFPSGLVMFTGYFSGEVSPSRTHLPDMCVFSRQWAPRIPHPMK